MNPYPIQNGTTNGGAPPRASREKVVFETNLPQALKLELDPPSQPRPGAFGDQYMYFVDGHRIAWLEPEVHAQILALNVGAGDMVAIVKRKSGRSNRWEVNRVEDGRVVANTQPVAAAAPQMVSAPRATAPGPIRAGNESIGISGNLMAAALTQAIEACELANFHAQPEDIRALAITIYIATTGGRK